MKKLLFVLAISAGLMGCATGPAPALDANESNHFIHPAIRRVDYSFQDHSRQPASPQSEGVYCGQLEQHGPTVVLNDHNPHKKRPYFAAEVPNSQRHDPKLFLSNGDLKGPHCVCIHGLIESKNENQRVVASENPKGHHHFSVVHSYESYEEACLNSL